MTSDRTHTDSRVDPRGLTVAPENDAATHDLADMREAADFLMVDEEAVAAILAAAGVPLIRRGEDTYASRRDLLTYREREIARRRAGMREITRLSIAAGLDDADYSALERDRA